MLALLGVAYFTDSIVAAMEERMREDIYNVYKTDCLYAICASLGVKLDRRYYDILHPEQVDTRTGAEIAYERLERFGIKVVD